MNIPIYQRKARQSGATLIVSLVILTIVTILGLASMRNSNLELKMAASTRDHSVAFQNAESALHILEKRIINPVTAFTRNQVEEGCGTGVGCFNATCTGGLCFDGQLVIGRPDSSCKIAKGFEQSQQMWKEDSIWKNINLHNTIDIPNTLVANTFNQVKYIVEFLCFTKDPTISVVSDNDKLYPLYRITVRSEGEAKRSTAMLQSVFRGASLARNITGSGAGDGGGEDTGDTGDEDGGGPPDGEGGESGSDSDAAEVI